MHTPLLALSLVLTCFISTVIAHNIQLGAYARECFHEQLHKDDKMTVSFQVGDREFGGAGNLEVDFWVSRMEISKFRHVQGSRPRLFYDPSSHTLISSHSFQATRERLAVIRAYLNNFCRFKTHSITTLCMSGASLPATTRSRPTPMGNTSIASATNTGRPRQKRFHSMSMELCTYRRRMRRRIRWR